MKNLLSFIYITIAAIPSTNFQNISKSGVKLFDIRSGSYTDYSRIVLDLEKDVNYNVIYDKENGAVKFLLENVKAAYKKLNKISDIRIKEIQVIKKMENSLEFVINYRSPKDAVYFFSLKSPPRLVIDIKKPVKEIFLQSRKELKTEENEEKNEEKKVLSEEKGIYNEALRLFQEHNYLEAIELFERLDIKFPNSRYKGEFVFLKAEANSFLIKKKESDVRVYINVIEQYKNAIREFPDSENVIHAKVKIAKLFFEIEFFSESMVVLEKALVDYPKNKYEQSIRFCMMVLQIKEKYFTRAYDNFIRGLAINPDNKASRKATVVIASILFKQNDFIVSEKLLEDVLRKWPNYLQSNPKLLFELGASYFENGKYERAKKNFFELVNLHPFSKFSRDGLIRIGDYYKINGKEKDSLKVYIELLARNPKGEIAGLSEIRMANIGVDNPDIKSKKEVFNYNPYLKPILTYQKIAEKYPERPLAEEALFKKGVAEFKGNNYIDAVLTLKEIIRKYPNSPFADKGVAFLRDILIKLIDTYYSQEGYFPIIFTYHENVDPFLEDITESRVLYKIGESYQKLGIYDVAKDTYLKASRSDKSLHYKKRIKLRLSEIYLEEGKYSKAEEVLSGFLKSYKGTPDYLYAQRLYAFSLYKQRKFEFSTNEYYKILKKISRIKNSSKVYYYLGRSLYGKKQFIKAEKAFKAALKNFQPIEDAEQPVYINDSYYFIGDSLYRAGKFSYAIPALKTAMKLYPDDEWLQYILGKSYEGIKESNKAKKVLTKLASSKGAFAVFAKTNLSEMEWMEKNKEHLVIK